MEANEKNEKIAFNRIYKVLLARWMVFRTFIEVAQKQNGGLLPNNIKHDWLIFQLLPFVVVDGKDPFLAFASLQTLLDLLDVTGPTAVLGSAIGHDNFFYILDEGQVAGERYMGAFADASATIRRPVLRPVVRGWSRVSTERSIKFIISGTGFSLDLFQTVLVSGVGKVPDQWDVVRNTGDFKNPGIQLSYISRYLPPSFLLSESGTSLVSRMFEWLRGRHRFTARYLEELIGGEWTTACPSSPHKLLDAYVHTYTKYTPIDGEGSLLATETDIKPPKVQGFAWEKIAREENILCGTRNDKTS
ncbi:hypothetical protein L208DRAFT_1384366 [Tricholoma matsutake]|nr:hypothetical protein L208DRAFT_1384366 [Tricholoma matsutake 945]